MRIERIRVEGFGALRGLDLAWPEGSVLLAVDPNETGKTTLCEAIVTALYGLPKTRGVATRVRELRRPRSGAPMRVGLDVSAGGRRWSIDRDLDAGTLRIVDRDRGLDATHEFLRPGGKDAFGETVTGGLGEALFRATAYVKQNVLDTDRLEAGLTVELARIADSGGGEASVVRALRALEEARREMPGATTGGAVSVDTEIARLGRRVDALKARRDALAQKRREAAQASAALAHRAHARNEAARRADLAGLAVVVSERQALQERLDVARAAADRRHQTESEVKALAPEAALFSAASLSEVDRLREERGTRPQALEAARAALERGLREASRDAGSLAHRFGAAARLSDGELETLEALLRALAGLRKENNDAEKGLEAQWESLRADGLAEELVRLDALATEDRDFVLGAEEERGALELEGVKLDRKVADAAALASIVAGERAQRVRLARGMVAAAVALVPVVAWFAWPAAGVPVYMTVSLAVFALTLGFFGAIGWGRANGHRIQDEARAREEEAAARRRATDLRRRLSDVRLRLDRVAKGAGFRDPAALLKAHRRVRSADERRRALAAATTRRDDAKARLAQVDVDLAPFRDALGLPPGIPVDEDATRLLEVLVELERVRQEARTREEVLAKENERLAREEADLRDLERRLRDALAATGVPAGLPLAEALLAVEAGRRKAEKFRQLREHELPARREAEAAGDPTELEARLVALDAEILRLTEEPGGVVPDAAGTPEEARRAAEEARAALARAEEDRLAAERTLAAAAREGGDSARDVEEDLETAETLLRRATLFRDAVDLARSSLSAAATSVYSDFRRGLNEASRAILASWRTPYEALEFSDELTLSALLKGGRVATRTEIESGLSTGAREQLHLTARLAALRYLGTGAAGVPLLLDDPLVGADDERFVAVMRFLLTEVLSERPVLVVSCHAWRHERLFAALEAGAAARLARVSLAPFSSLTSAEEGGDGAAAASRD
jgi:DNA repair exonuclease SbcCD ATPase subunit